MIIPRRDGRVATVAADQTSLVDVGIAVNHQMADGIPFTRVQIAQFAIIAAVVAVTRLTVAPFRFLG